MRGKPRRFPNMFLNKVVVYDSVAAWIAAALLNQPLVVQLFGGRLFADAILRQVADRQHVKAAVRTLADKNRRAIIFRHCKVDAKKTAPSLPVDSVHTAAPKVIYRYIGFGCAALIQDVAMLAQKIFPRRPRFPRIRGGDPAGKA